MDECGDGGMTSLPQRVHHAQAERREHRPFRAPRCQSPDSALKIDEL